MAPTQEEQTAADLRATERARALLKPGDRIRCTGCGGKVATYKFIAWDRSRVTDEPNSWIISASRDDLHASHIIRLNGQPHSFRDDPSAHLADPSNSNAGHLYR